MREVDHAQSRLRAVLLRVVDDLSLGQAVGQLDLVADQAHLPGFAVIGGIDRDDGQANQRAFFAANLVDDLVEFHLDDIERFAILALGHGDDAVSRLEFFTADGRATGDEFDEFGVAVVPLQTGADAG